MTIDRNYESQFINGEWVKAGTDEFETVINPATGETICEVQSASEGNVDAAVAAAKAAFEGTWGKTTPRERSEALHKFADAIAADLKEMIRLESLNGGKPLSAAQWEYDDFVLDSLRFFAGAARNLEGIAAGDYLEGRTSFVRRDPLGVVAGIVPWNYPGEQAIWKLGPALAAGNTIVLKPSEGTPLSAMRLVETAAKFFPRGVVNLVTGKGREVGRALAGHPDVSLISVTGSERTGIDVASNGAPTLTRTHLELGGNAPVVIFEDADLNLVREVLPNGAFFNAGQDCTAASRMIVHESLVPSVIEILVQEAEKLVYGDPLGESGDTVTLGPLASEVQCDRVEGYVSRAVSDGATIHTGGSKAVRPGFFYIPTVVSGLTQDSEIIQEEIFGPVVTVQSFRTANEALDMANGVRQGLAASVWTQDISTAMVFAKEMKFGTVWVNEHLPLVAELPHGGFKASGHGRDMSRHAIEDYMDVKHVMIRHSS